MKPLVLVASLWLLQAVPSVPQTEQAAEPQNAQVGAPREEASAVNRAYPVETGGTESRRDQEGNAQRYILWFTGILAGASIFQFGALLFTYKLMRDTARRQLRAYMCPSRADIIGPPNHPGILRPEVVVKNSGQTPAYKTRGWIVAALRNWPNPKMPKGLDKFVGTNQIIGPQGTMCLRTDEFIPINLDTWKQICDGTKIFYVVGRITYEDIFGKEQ